MVQTHIPLPIWKDVMSRRRYPKSAFIARRKARETEQLIFGVLLLLALVTLWATDLWSPLIAWVSDLILEQITQVGNT